MKRTKATGFVTAIALLMSATGASAAGPHHRVSALGRSCQGSASAISQYCEEIPTPSGGQHPGQGTSTLIGTLPPQAVNKLVHTLQLRPLLRIPAPVGAPPGGVRGLGFPGLGSAGSGQGVDSSTIWTSLVLVLVLIALLMGGLEIVRRRRLVSRPG